MSTLEELEDPEEGKIGEALQHSNLGLLYHQWGKTTKAESSLRAAIMIYTDLRRDDDCAPLYASLSKLYLDIEQFDEAGKAAKRSLDLYRYRRGVGEQMNVLTKLLEEISRRKRGV